MARYYFDLINDEDLIDCEGRELDDADMPSTAVDEAKTMLCASVASGKVDLAHFIQVRDTGGAQVFRIEFGEAVRFLRDGQPV